MLRSLASGRGDSRRKRAGGGGARKYLTVRSCLEESARLRCPPDSTPAQCRSLPNHFAPQTAMHPPEFPRTGGSPEAPARTPGAGRGRFGLLQNGFALTGNDSRWVQNHFAWVGNRFAWVRNDFAWVQNRFGWVQNHSALAKNGFGRVENDFGRVQNHFAWVQNRFRAVENGSKSAPFFKRRGFGRENATFRGRSALRRPSPAIHPSLIASHHPNRRLP